MLKLCSIVAPQRTARFVDPIRLQLYLLNLLPKPVPLSWKLVAVTGPADKARKMEVLSHDGRASVPRGVSVVDLVCPDPAFSAFLRAKHDPGWDLIGKSCLKVQGCHDGEEVVSARVEVETKFKRGAVRKAWNGYHLHNECAAPRPREHLDQILRVIYAERAGIRQPWTDWSPKLKLPVDEWR